MIEGLIYWAGVTALLSASVLATLFSVYLISRGFSKLLAKELRRSYNHVQLLFFMAKLKEKGYAQCVTEIGKE